MKRNEIVAELFRLQDKEYARIVSQANEHADKIIQERKKNGWSQEELAEYEITYLGRCLSED